MGKIYSSILELIGNTPILHPHTIDAAERPEAHRHPNLDG